MRKHIATPKNEKYLRVTEIYKVQQGDLIIVPQNPWKHGVVLKKQNLTDFDVITEDSLI